MYRGRMSTDALLKEITHVQSVQRLRFIRQAIFEVGIEYVMGEGEHIPWLFGDLSIKAKNYLRDELDVEFQGLSYAQLADFHDLNLSSWQKARWAADLAFTCWWYKLAGKNGAYIEAIATPIKNWVLEWFGEDALALTDKDYIPDPKEFFSEQRMLDLLYEINFSQPRFW